MNSVWVTHVYFGKGMEMTSCTSVDDILMVSNSRKFLNLEKIIMGSRFPMWDLGKATYILGMKIVHDRKSRRMLLSQEGYIQEILKKFKMENCKPVSTPVDTNVKLLKNDGDPVNQVQYQSLVRSLIYTASGSSMSKKPLRREGWITIQRRSVSWCFSNGCLTRSIKLHRFVQELRIIAWFLWKGFSKHARCDAHSVNHQRTQSIHV